MRLWVPTPPGWHLMPPGGRFWVALDAALGAHAAFVQLNKGRVGTQRQRVLQTAHPHSAGPASVQSAGPTGVQSAGTAGVQSAGPAGVGVDAGCSQHTTDRWPLLTSIRSEADVYFDQHWYGCRGGSGCRWAVGRLGRWIEDWTMWPLGLWTERLD